MRLEFLITAGIASLTLASVTVGAPTLAATLGGSLLLGAIIRNTAVLPGSCLSTNMTENHCHYTNNCDFMVGATSGRGIKLIEPHGQSPCLKEELGFIPSSRADVSVTRNLDLRDCAVFKKSQNNQTIIRNHCNKDIQVQIRDNERHTTYSFPVKNNQKRIIQIPFDVFGEDDINVKLRRPAVITTPLTEIEIQTETEKKLPEEPDCNNTNALQAQAMEDLGAYSTCMREQEKLEEINKSTRKKAERKGQALPTPSPLLIAKKEECKIKSARAINFGLQLAKQQKECAKGSKNTGGTGGKVLHEGKSRVQKIKPGAVFGDRSSH